MAQVRYLFSPLEVLVEEAMASLVLALVVWAHLAKVRLSDSTSQTHALLELYAESCCDSVTLTVGTAVIGTEPMLSRPPGS
jgi:hypothetical protein